VIFVTVGNAKQPFTRLLEAVERLAGERAFAKEEVLVQSGSSREFSPLYCSHVPFLSPEDFQASVRAATVIICHGGAGTLLHVFQAGKVPIVVPRGKRYGEAIDDHQSELTRVLAAEGRVIPVYEVTELPAAIAEARRYRAEAKEPAGRRAMDLLTKAIEEIAGRVVPEHNSGGGLAGRSNDGDDTVGGRAGTS